MEPFPARRLRGAGRGLAESCMFPNEETEWDDAPAPGEEPGAEAQPDPLAELTDEQQAALNARLEQVRTETETRYRKATGRFGNTVNHLRAMGFDLAEDGTPLARDPQLIQQLPSRLGFPAPPASPQQVAAAPPPPPLEEAPDPYDADAYRTWTERRIQRGIEEGLQKAIDPILQRLEGIGGVISDLTLPSTMQPLDTARATLDAYGQSGYAALPEFHEAYKNALAQMEPQARRDPTVQRSAALLAMDYLVQQGVRPPSAPAPAPGTPAGPPPGAPARPSPQALARDASRAGLTQLGGTAGGRSAEAPQYTAEDVEMARLHNMPVELWVAAGDEDPRVFNAARQQLKQRQAANGGRR